MTLYPIYVSMSFTRSNISSPRKSKTAIFKYLTMFFLWATCITLMTNALEINTRLENVVQYIHQIFLTSDGSNSGTTGIILDGSGGNAWFQWDITMNGLTGLAVLGTDASGKFISSTSGIIYNLISWFVLSWPQWNTWATGATWVQWIQWIQWNTWATGATWAQWIQWNTWATGATWVQWIQWNTWATGATWPAGTGVNNLPNIIVAGTNAMGTLIAASSWAIYGLISWYNYRSPIAWGITYMWGNVVANGMILKWSNTQANGDYTTVLGNGTKGEWNYSTAIGYGSIAVGAYSIAMWYNSTTSSDYSMTLGYLCSAGWMASTAMGSWTTANGIWSIAMGIGTIAYGVASTAIGQRNIGSSASIFEIWIGTWASYRANAMTIKTGGDISFPLLPNLPCLWTNASGTLILWSCGGGYRSPIAWWITYMWGNIVTDGFVSKGTWTTANGDYALSMWHGASANTTWAIAIGVQSISSGYLSVAIWFTAEALGDYSITLWVGVSATNTWSMAIGVQNDSSGIASLAMGRQTQAIGDSSTTMWFNTIALGNASIAMWKNTTGAGDYSVAMGFETKASAESSVAMGYQTQAGDKYSVAMGYNTIMASENGVAMGKYNIGYKNTLLEIGMWAYGALANALTVRAEWWVKISDSTIDCVWYTYGTIKFSWDNFYWCTAASGRVQLNN